MKIVDNVLMIEMVDNGWIVRTSEEDLIFESAREARLFISNWQDQVARGDAE